MSVTRTPRRNTRMLTTRRVVPAVDAVKIALCVAGLVVAIVFAVIASIVLGAV